MSKPSQQEPESRKVFVSGLSADTTKDQVETLLSDIGPIKKAFVVYDNETKKCKGYGFVMFAIPSDATRAVKELNGKQLNGAKIKLEFARMQLLKDKKAKRKEQDSSEEEHFDDVPAASAKAKPAQKQQAAAAVAAAPPKPKPTKQEAKELKQKVKVKQARIIIRNMPFKLTEAELVKTFQPFGTVLETRIPKIEGSDRVRGFCFVQMANKLQAAKAIKHMNGKELLGRVIAVDFAMAKNRYEDQVKATESPDEADEKAPRAASESESGDSDSDRSAASGDDAVQDASSDRDGSSGLSDVSDASEQDASDSDEGSESDSEKGKDVAREVFVRNLPIDATVRDLKTAFSPFGKVTAAYLVRDRETGQPRGSGFVQFADAAAAAAAVAAGAPPMQVASQAARAGATVSAMDRLAGSITVCGRRVVVSQALPRNAARDLSHSEHDAAPKDKRNLYLANEGYIEAGTPAAEGVSEADMAKRLAIHKSRMEKLHNSNFRVSETRLCVRNLPRDLDEKGLRALVATSLDDVKEIRQVKIVRDTKRVKENQPRSKCYGFVEFGTHASALAVLRRLNNNPAVWGVQKRPIVEFAVDDARKMLQHTRVQRWGTLSQDRSNYKQARKERRAAAAAGELDHDGNEDGAGPAPTSERRWRHETHDDGDKDALAGKRKREQPAATARKQRPDEHVSETKATGKRSADGGTEGRKRVKGDTSRPSEQSSEKRFGKPAPAQQQLRPQQSRPQQSRQQPQRQEKTARPIKPSALPPMSERSARRQDKREREKQEEKQFDSLVSDYKKRIFGDL